MSFDEEDKEMSMEEFFSPTKDLLLADQSQPKHPSTSNKKFLKKRSKRVGESGKPVKCVKRAKISQTLEKTAEPGKAKKGERKDTHNGSAKSASQSSRVKSTKNSTKYLTKKRDIKSKAHEQPGEPVGHPQLITDTQENSAEKRRSRKSLRLRKRESNLTECKGCTCKRSQCIKLYCECFLKQGFCSPACCCEDCFNMEENEEEIVKIRNKITARNPHAFQNKLKVTDEDTGKHKIAKSQVSPRKKVRHIKGCN